MSQSPTDLGLLTDTLNRIGAQYNFIDEARIAEVAQRDGPDASQSVSEYAMVYELDEDVANEIEIIIELSRDFAFFFDNAGNCLGQALYEEMPFTPSTT